MLAAGAHGSKTVEVCVRMVMALNIWICISENRFTVHSDRNACFCLYFLNKIDKIYLRETM